MLKIFKKKETKKVWKVAYSDNVIHYGEVVAKFTDYNEAVKFKKERENNDQSIEWFIF
jgi:hypothetical protein